MPLRLSYVRAAVTRMLPKPAKSCTVDGCSNTVHAYSHCKKHYRRLRKHGSTELPQRPTAAERFWRKVAVGAPDECWPWTERATHTFGYGSFSVGYRKVGAHVYAYELTNGPVPDGLQVMHCCDNPPCCNAAHLSAGTSADNLRDMRDRGRSR
jgi:hypothetical protein